MTEAASTKIQERLEKLLRLANSGNEHEAAVATARAAELMTKYQLEEPQPDGIERTPVVDVAIDVFGRRVTWRGILASGIAYAFGAGLYWSRDAFQTELKLVGRRDAVSAVQYMYKCLADEVNRLTDREWANLGYGARSWKSAFRVGVATTIAERLREARDETLKTARSAAVDDASSARLARIDEGMREVEQYMEQRALGCRLRISVGSEDGLRAGQSSGLNVNIPALSDD